MKKFTIDKTKIAKLLVLIFMFITIGDLFFKIKIELRKEKLDGFNFAKHGKEESVLDLKSCSDLGWFNLAEPQRDYKYGLDIVFICFQYMVVPTMLENNGSNKKIICYYTSPEQLVNFCQKKTKYKLIEKDIFSYFALLERKD